MVEKELHNESEANETRKPHLYTQKQIDDAHEEARRVYEEASNAYHRPEDEGDLERPHTDERFQLNEAIDDIASFERGEEDDELIKKYLDRAKKREAKESLNENPDYALETVQKVEAILITQPATEYDKHGVRVPEDGTSRVVSETRLITKRTRSKDYHARLDFKATCLEEIKGIEPTTTDIEYKFTPTNHPGPITENEIIAAEQFMLSLDDDPDWKNYVKELAKAWRESLQIEVSDEDAEELIQHVMLGEAGNGMTRKQAIELISRGTNLWPGLEAVKLAIINDRTPQEISWKISKGTNGKVIVSSSMKSGAKGTNKVHEITVEPVLTKLASERIAQYAQSVAESKKNS